MAPLAATKTFVLSTRWGVVIVATSSGVPGILTTGKVSAVYICNKIDWVV